MTGETEKILEERRQTHGGFEECAGVSQDILRAMRRGSSSDKWSDVQTEALQMIAMKQHRIACGDPNQIDHWLDISGYAMLVVKHLRGEA